MPNKEIEVSTDNTVEEGNILTEAALLRRFVYDIVPCPAARRLATKVDLTGVSDEGHEVEHRASHARLSLTDPIDVPMADALAALVKVYDHLLDEVVQIGPMPPGGREAMREVFMTLISRTLASGVPTVVATLIDLGYLIAVSE